MRNTLDGIKKKEKKERQKKRTATKKERKKKNPILISCERTNDVLRECP
jgi:hypothetical protein